METCLRSFKKIFRENSSRYLGYYLDRQAEEISTVSSDSWNGIDWDVLWQARKETIDKKLDKRTGIDKNRFGEYLKTGSIDRVEWMFKDSVKKDIGLEMFFA
jgi:transposase-like protein